MADMITALTMPKMGGLEGVAGIRGTPEQMHYSQLTHQMGLQLIIILLDSVIREVHLVKLSLTVVGEEVLEVPVVIIILV
jgi:hypothetical protein